MIEENQENRVLPVNPTKTRRAVIRTVAEVGVTTAAVTLLLGAATKPASAQSLYDPANVNLSREQGGQGGSGPVDKELNDDPNLNGDLPQGNHPDDVPGVVPLGN